MVQAIGVFSALLALSGEASAQRNATEAWDPSARDFSSGTPLAPSTPGATGAAGGNSLDSLNKILSASQLSAFDRSIYLSIRAFQLSRLGREAESQKDIAEMGKVLPGNWQVVLSSTMPGLAGSGDRAAALRTLDSALQRKPGDPSLMMAQAQVYMQIADFSRALGLLDTALAAAQTPVERRSALYYRGLANLNLGNFPQAIEDFGATLADRPNFKSKQSPLLWRYAAQVGARRDARTALTREVGTESLNEWPGPIIRYLIGKGTAGELEVAAETDDAAKRTNGKCPAAFFMGVEALRRGEKQRAREQFQLAQARCPTTSEFNWAASSELKRL
ncbi:tetratricopeptide repeat protein [Reyranella sp. MMS21-HV4-11]|jgi:tetratricopeptide (TPR) repeat protein|uniref:Tetratricopeptide repeat protein n=1 Tax=Reyranella humidisoli TaxID=2849149 RepID=A0ABS6IHN7_9HYPH|nr:tetratricopeptide repeat protein [Reyranella sp. MMS21-HV4-11]MBU8873500.1 tetratricopeptide repeat protein [Reyranella sp. MMS21-HV4-11]